jgi:hypothetical protein
MGYSEVKQQCPGQSGTAYQSAYHPRRATAPSSGRRRTMWPLTSRRGHQADVNGMEEVRGSSPLSSSIVMSQDISTGDHGTS